VIHNISLPPGQFGGGFINQLFLGCLDCNYHPFFEQLQGLEVSAHFMISRDGQLTQYVSTAERAWHAGVSCFDTIANCNDYSIGIELEGTDTLAYTDVQYRSLTSLTKSIQRRYPLITTQRVTGHCDIAPGRKTDPGKIFDWQRFKSGL